MNLYFKGNFKDGNFQIVDDSGNACKNVMVLDWQYPSKTDIQFIILVENEFIIQEDEHEK